MSRLLRILKIKSGQFSKTSFTQEVVKIVEPETINFCSPTEDFDRVEIKFFREDDAALALSVFKEKGFNCELIPYFTVSVDQNSQIEKAFLEYAAELGMYNRATKKKIAVTTNDPNTVELLKKFVTEHKEKATITNQENLFGGKPPSFYLAKPIRTAHRVSSPEIVNPSCAVVLANLPQDSLLSAQIEAIKTVSEKLRSVYFIFDGAQYTGVTIVEFIEENDRSQMLMDWEEVIVNNTFIWVEGFRVEDHEQFLSKDVYSLLD